MKNLIPIALTASVVLGALGCARQQPEPGTVPPDNLTGEVAEELPNSPPAPEIAKLAPESTQVLFSDEVVSVVAVHLDPKQLIPPYAAQGQYVYPESSFTLSVDRGGQEDVRHFAPGELQAWQPGRYGLENVGDTKARFLLVGRTKEPLPSTAELPVEIDTELDGLVQQAGTILLDDDSLLAIDAKLEAGQALVIPGTERRLILALTPGELTLFESGTNETLTLDKGMAAWIDAGVPVGVPAGGTPIHLLAFEFKM